MASNNNIVVARVLLPDDANVAGNVHGGTTLKLMEEAGTIAASRYVNKGGGKSIASLVRFEHMSFHKSILVGEVASCTCEIIFTSNQSILVEVVVHSEDLTKGETNVTNTGWLWYVPLGPPDSNTENEDWYIAKVPSMPTLNDDDAIKKYEKAKSCHERRKSTCGKINCGEDPDAAAKQFDLETDSDEFETFKQQYTIPSEGRSPSESEQVLCQIVHPGDCGKYKVAFGGFVMKLMDNSAGCSAWRHCRTNVVTVAISDMDFVSFVRLGDLCTIKSRVVFVSSKSLEIEVIASVASVLGTNNGDKDTIVARGLFTFVSLNSDGKVQVVPKLKLESEQDKRNFYMGQKRYEAAKKARLQRS